MYSTQRTHDTARKAPLRLISSLLVCVVWLFPAYAADSDAELPEAGPITLQSPNGLSVPAELRYFRVPENRNKPGGRQIQLAFLHFKSEREDPLPPAIYLSGGPGASGINQIRAALDRLVLPMLEDRDVIALDQRGTGLSNPLPPCGPDWWFPLDAVVTQEMWDARLAEIVGGCAAYWRDQGVDLAAYDTEESADDLEALRRVLGVERIALWGMSYGSHLALAYLKRHPASLARMVIAGVEGPDHTLKLPLDLERVIDEIDRKTAAHPEWALPPLRRTIPAVLARLEQEPVRVDVAVPNLGKRTVTISKHDLQLVTASVLKRTKTQTKIPLFFKRMVDGDFSAVAKRVAALHRGHPLNPMGLAMDAASWSSPERLNLIGRQRESALLGDAANRSFEVVAAHLGVTPLAEDFRTPVASEVPVLMISGSLDGRTPVSNGEEVLRGLPNGVHLIVENVAHEGSLLAGRLTRDKVLAFMRGEKVTAARLVESEPRWAVEGTPTILTEAELAAYAGRYRMPDRVITLASTENGLIARDRSGSFSLSPRGKGVFVNAKRRIRVRFRTEEGHKVTGFETRMGGKRVFAVRVE
ncbi:Alpha/beta fold hydrolase [Sulfidibacter corallicola]|uniref:Alpha/beta fold hydrolase n=1 Tax=Sulfidibacter corallicola TaxID=2818388 RepID=A0A8A4TKY8_SULCO|nr:alpha/beta fold hydrolase [Sulfidibacter corallicola]QTD49541.1 alpha/beta fold hydrolase [Sulfidibacter corallicola]